MIPAPHRAGERRLIITGDDFGASPAVNEAVIRACREGVLRFASLMVAEPFAEEAVRLARSECIRLNVGLHVVLCAGLSALGHDAVGELADSRGRFPDDPVACGLRYFFDRSLGPALERELRAQFERFLAFGLAPGHADGHLNIHAHPVIFPMLSRLCREYGFGRIRLPGGEFRISMGFSPRPFWKQAGEALVFSLLRRYLLRACADPLIEVPGSVLGLLRSGLMREDYVIHCLKRLPEGLSEIYFHPSADPSSEAQARPTPTHRTITELRTLLSPEVRSALASCGARLLGDSRAEGS